MEKKQGNTVSVKSPFGGDAKLIAHFPVALIKALYFVKCGVDVSKWFGSNQYISLFQCKLTDYKWWAPGDVAGDEDFYKLLARNWDNYYRENRWEYKYARKFILTDMCCLEIGCGRGFFLRLIEKSCGKCNGLEFNQQAIDEKVCDSPIIKESIENYSAKIGATMDVVLAFQVLEHIINPMDFLSSSLACVKPGGLLVLSTPNDDFYQHQRMLDAFNLPPHHVGCYNTDIYRNIAHRLGVDLLNVIKQPCNYEQVRYSDLAQNSFVFRLYQKFVSKVGGALLRFIDEPGHTMMVVFQKPFG